MAEKRMVSISLVDDDRFLDMSAGAQLLYFHLSMRADDDGFFSSRKLMRTVNSKRVSLDELEKKGYVILFESGAGCIVHWFANNTIQKDRYKESLYPEKKLVELINVDGRKEYRLKSVSTMETGNGLEDSELGNRMDTACIQNGDGVDTERKQNGNKMESQDRIGKGKKELSLSKESSSKKESAPSFPERFQDFPSNPEKPTPEEVNAYFKGNLLKGDPQGFFNHYESIGWMIGSNPVRDWKAAARKWSSNENRFFSPHQGHVASPQAPRDYDGSYDGHSMKEATL